MLAVLVAGFALFTACASQTSNSSANNQSTATAQDESAFGGIKAKLMAELGVVIGDPHYF